MFKYVEYLAIASVGALVAMIVWNAYMFSNSTCFNKDTYCFFLYEKPNIYKGW